MIKQKEILPKCVDCKNVCKKVETTYWCKLNRVMRLVTSTCCWNTKQYPSKFQKKDPTEVKGELIHQSSWWKVYKQDAGMGESDYCVFFNDVFFCRTDDAIIALRIIRAVDVRVGGWT